MIDFSKATPDEREATLGREFREIHVAWVDFKFPTMTRALIEGRFVVLVGDPVGALKTYLGGKAETQPAAH